MVSNLDNSEHGISRTVDALGTILTRTKKNDWLQGLDVQVLRYEIDVKIYKNNEIAYQLRFKPDGTLVDRSRSALGESIPEL